MINKFKNIARRGISLLLAVGMMVPSGVYAESYNASNWDDYRDKLKTAIMKQDKDITIKIVDNGINTPYLAQSMIKSEYDKTIENMPTYLGGFNIISNLISPEVDGTLKSVKHEIGYKITNDKISIIKPLLNTQYAVIKTKATDYEKIKAVFDFAVAELKKVEADNEPAIINKALSGQGENAHAFLIAMMLTDLGYENDIASVKEGAIGYRWNLVKIQGKWYHVDGKAEHFLISKNSGVTKWDKEKDVVKSGGKSDLSDIINFFPNDPYVGTNHIVSQLEYEIKLIKDEISKISDEMIKNDFDAIVKKANDYVVRKGILKVEIDKIPYTTPHTLDDKLNDLENDIKTLQATIAVVKAETTIIIGDVNAAKDLVKALPDGVVKNGLNARLDAVKNVIDDNDAEQVEINNAIAAVVVAENTLINAVDDDYKVNLLVNSTVNSVKEAAVGAEALINALSESAIKDELLSRIDEIYNVKSAKDKIVSAEKNGGATRENIDIAKSYVTQINAKYIIIKKNLENRIVKLEAELKSAEEAEVIKKAKEAVDHIETNIKKILSSEPVYSLEIIISDSEAAVKTAEIEVKKIKNTTAKTEQQNRIKYLKLIITAIKAVEKVEETPKATNVTSATKAIVKVKEATFSSKIEGEADIIKVLNDKVGIVDEKIKATDAEKLVEKAETSLKRADYEKAETAVVKLKNPESDLEVDQTGTYLALANRIDDNFKVISAKEAVENAEKLMKANKSDVSIYETAFATAKEDYIKTEKVKPDIDEVDEFIKYNKYMEIYKARLDDLNKRIEEVEVAIAAIKAVDEANVLYLKYLSEPNDTNKENLEDKINGTVTSVGAAKEVEEISDNNASLLSIKKSLVARLKVVSDKLTADGDYSTVSGLLSDVEINLKTRLEKDVDIIEKAIEIDLLEKSMVSIAESTKI